MTLRLAWLNSVHDIGETQWQALWQNDRQADYPFVQFGFLSALEDSECTTLESGWQPKHLCAFETDPESKQEVPVALWLGYLKTHSYGEYVFDWGWADAYERSGRQYYPKWLSAIPFTPATGPRLAIAQHLDPNDVVEQMRGFLINHCHEHQWSSWHCLFPRKETREQLNGDNQHSGGSLERLGCQFHWFNQDYDNFEDFLSSFNSRKRKSLKKERRGVEQAGITLTRATGQDISSADWDLFYRFYHTTYLKRSGSTGYLNRDFFELLHQRCADQILMVKAEKPSDEKDNNMIAAALYFFDNDTLYGRYWGCMEEVPGLHFEACYYQGIEFAIEKGLKRFDPGAQGEHKIQRGFTPTLTYSNHWLTEPMFYDAVADFLERETPSIKAYQKECSELLPFKKSD